MESAISSPSLAQKANMAYPSSSASQPSTSTSTAAEAASPRLPTPSAPASTAGASTSAVGSASMTAAVSQRASSSSILAEGGVIDPFLSMAPSQQDHRLNEHAALPTSSQAAALLSQVLLARSSADGGTPLDASTCTSQFAFNHNTANQAAHLQRTMPRAASMSLASVLRSAAEAELKRMQALQEQRRRSSTSATLHLSQAAGFPPTMLPGQESSFVAPPSPMNAATQAGHKRAWEETISSSQFLNQAGAVAHQFAEFFSQERAWAGMALAAAVRRSSEASSGTASRATASFSGSASGSAGESSRASISTMASRGSKSYPLGVALVDDGTEASGSIAPPMKRLRTNTSSHVDLAEDAEWSTASQSAQEQVPTIMKTSATPETVKSQAGTSPASSLPSLTSHVSGSAAALAALQASHAASTANASHSGAREQEAPSTIPVTGSSVSMSPAQPYRPPTLAHEPTMTAPTALMATSQSLVPEPTPISTTVPRSGSLVALLSNFAQVLEGRQQVARGLEALARDGQRLINDTVGEGASRGAFGSSAFDLRDGGIYGRMAGAAGTRMLRRPSTAMGIPGENAYFPEAAAALAQAEAEAQAEAQAESDDVETDADLRGVGSSSVSEWTESSVAETPAAGAGSLSLLGVGDGHRLRRLSQRSLGSNVAGGESADESGPEAMRCSSMDADTSAEASAAPGAVAAPPASTGPAPPTIQLSRPLTRPIPRYASGARSSASSSSSLSRPGSSAASSATRLVQHSGFYPRGGLSSSTSFPAARQGAGRRPVQPQVAQLRQPFAQAQRRSRSVSPALGPPAADPSPASASGSGATPALIYATSPSFLRQYRPVPRPTEASAGGDASAPAPLTAGAARPASFSFGASYDVAPAQDTPRPATSSSVSTASAFASTAQGWGQGGAPTTITTLASASASAAPLSGWCAWRVQARRKTATTTTAPAQEGASASALASGSSSSTSAPDASSTAAAPSTDTKPADGSA